MRVVVVSTHRSDKGHYAPLLRLLRGDTRFEVTLYAVNDFYATPDYIDAVRPLHKTRGSLPDTQYDAGIVLGDRYEMLLAAVQLVEARIPLLHIHGGEHTYGSLDERWRWAMTAIADVHCVSTLAAKIAVRGRRHSHDRPYQKRIFVTGAPGLDDIQERQPVKDAPKVIVLYNPAIDIWTTHAEVRAIADAIGPDVPWYKPNGDRFSDIIPWTHDELDSEKFRDLLAAAHVIVSNSSAGIIEAPSLGTWTVNVGERQAGRPRASSVLDWNGNDLRGAITDVLARPKPTNVANPYGDGHASPRIRDVLLGMMAS